MSRLNGRVVFPGSSENSQPSSNDVRSGISTGVPENQKAAQPRRRGRGFNQNNLGPERFERHERNDERSERGQPPKLKNDRSVRLERSEKPERDLRYERPHQSYKTERFERSERGEKQERREEPAEKPRKPTARVEDVVTFEELLEVEDIVAQIGDLTVRNDRSAAEIKRNILGSKDLLDTMSDGDWHEVCRAMISTALDQGEPEFIADLIVALFHIETFTAAMSEELTVVSSAHIIEQDGKPLPALLANVLCAFWPRQFSKAFDNVNLILYYAVSLIKGWIQLLSEDTERYYKAEKKPKYPVREDEEEEKKEEVEEEKIIEEPEVVNQCALALSELCDTAQKQLWIKWAEVTDEIYQCLKPAITHNPNISGDVKARLLDTFMQINQWSKNRSTSVKHSQTQTVSTSSD